MNLLMRLLKNEELIFSIKHIDNSAGAMELHSKGFDMMRLGIVIYGLYPSEEMDKSVSSGTCNDLKGPYYSYQKLPAGKRYQLRMDLCYRQKTREWQLFRQAMPTVIRDLSQAGEELSSEESMRLYSEEYAWISSWLM